MNDPTRAPVKRYSWRANSMRALSLPGINLLWSTRHIEETTFKKSSLVKLYFCFFLFTTFPSLVKVFFIHYIPKRMLVLLQTVRQQQGLTLYTSFLSVSATSVPVVSLNPPKSRSAHALAVLTVGFPLLQSRPWVEFAYQRMNSFTISWLGGKQPGTVL